MISDMIKHTFIFTLTALFFLSCTRKAETVVVELPTLPVSSIYNEDSVYTYINNHYEKNIAVAEAYYDKALKLKEENPAKAIYYFKRAITLYPTIESYKEAGALLIKEGNYEEASKLYSFIVLPHHYYNQENEWTSKFVFEQPDLDTYYQYFFSSVVNNRPAPYSIYQAKEAGIDMEKFKSRILSDDRLKLDTSSLDYKNMMMQFWTEEEIEAFKNSEANFKLFLSTIMDTAGVFEITKKGVQKFNYSSYNGMNEYFEEPGTPNIQDMYVYYLKEKQDDPKGWYHFNCEHLINLSDSVKVVIYAIDTSATGCPIDMRHIYHRLVTYGVSGKIIDSKIVAYQAGEALATLKFVKDKFTISEFRRSWRNPYDQNDFDNDLLKTEATGEELFYINPQGKIGEALVEVNQPVE
jgi:tetratricopeptide (TPR) repeat protein